MDYLWPIIIIISYIYALINGNMEKVNEAIFDSITDVIQLSITLLGNMCLWCGIMNIIKSTSMIYRLKKVLKPILNILFPEEKNNKNVIDNISINIVSNMLGIGNAATPAGLQAMKEMKKNNDQKDITNSMAMLIILNTTSIQIIPTTVIALMMSFGESNPTKIVAPIWISTLAGTMTAIIITKAISNIKRRRER